MTNVPVLPEPPGDDRTGALALTNEPVLPDAESDERIGALAFTSVPVPVEAPLDDRMGALALTSVPLPSALDPGVGVESTGAFTVAIVPVWGALPTVPAGALTATSVEAGDPPSTTGVDPEVAGSGFPTDVVAVLAVPDEVGIEPVQLVAAEAGVIDPAPAKVSPATAARMATTAAPCEFSF